MKEENDPLIWIKESDKTQQKWAYQYLAKKGFVFPPHTLDKRHDLIINHLRSWSAKKEFIRSMRLAWNQQKQRIRDKQQNKKAYNFVMSLQAKKRLESLANSLKKTIAQTLEDMIIEAGDYKENLAKDAQQELKLKKEKMDQQYKKRDEGRVSRAELINAERAKNKAMLINMELFKFADEQIKILCPLEACEYANTNEDVLKTDSKVQDLYKLKKQQLEKISTGLYFSKWKKAEIT